MYIVHVNVTYTWLYSTCTCYIHVYDTFKAIKDNNRDINDSTPSINKLLEHVSQEPWIRLDNTYNNNNYMYMYIHQNIVLLLCPL